MSITSKKPQNIAENVRRNSLSLINSIVWCTLTDFSFCTKTVLVHIGIFALKFQVYIDRKF